jgi:SAM-dependent methyltransferase
MTTMRVEDWDSRYRKARESVDTRLWSAIPTTLLPESVAGWRQGRALDLATGDGRNAIWLAQNGWKVTAVDFSAEAIASARRHARDAGVEINWQCADVTGWLTDPTHDSLYDLITIIYLHISHAELTAAISLAQTLLAPDGHLLVIGHDVENIGSGTSGPADAAILYSPELLTSAVRPGSVERCDTVSRDVAADPESSSERIGTARDTILIASA